MHRSSVRRGGDQEVFLEALSEYADVLGLDGRDEEALEWLRPGMVTFASDDRLRSLAAECHLRAGRRLVAEELMWQNFEARPGLATYVALHETAGDGFTSWRDRALEVLGEAPVVTARFAIRPFLHGVRHSELVEVLLWEDDVDAAWRAGCGRLSG